VTVCSVSRRRRRRSCSGARRPRPLPPSHSSCNGGSVDSGNTHPRPAAPRRVVEQYLWHEKTKGRKHKMQIHTYHKVSERRPRSHPSATSAAVAVAAAAAVPAAAAAAEKPCAPRRGRRGSSTRQSSWTMVHMLTRRTRRCGARRSLPRRAQCAISNCPLIYSGSWKTGNA
jgi:hypothetical protein